MKNNYISKEIGIYEAIDKIEPFGNLSFEFKEIKAKT